MVLWNLPDCCPCGPSQVGRVGVTTFGLSESSAKATFEALIGTACKTQADKIAYWASDQPAYASYGMSSWCGSRLERTNSAVEGAHACFFESLVEFGVFTHIHCMWIMSVSFSCWMSMRLLLSYLRPCAMINARPAVLHCPAMICLILGADWF